MTPSTLRDSAIDRAEQRYREALAESALICAKAIDAAEEARRQSDLRATNERRLELTKAWVEYGLAMESA